MEGDTCEVCFAGTLAVQAGMLICEVCGSTVQHYAEETQEFQAGITDSRFVRKASTGGSQRSSQPVKEREHADIHGGLLAYVGVLQQLLLKQVQELIHTMGASLALAGIAEELWLAYLTKMKILEPNFAKALESKAHAKEQQRTSSGHSREFEESFSVLRGEVECVLQSTLPISTSLVICCLSCWYAREAISPLDIVQGALDGWLPYLEFARDSKEALQPFSAVFSRGYLTPTGVLGPALLASRAADIAAALEIAHTPLNASVWMRRFVHDLILPTGIFPVAVALYDMYSPLFPDSTILSLSNPLHPWALAIVFVVLAVKLTCRLDGQDSVLKELSINATWIDWARLHFENMPKLSTFPLQSTEVLKGDAAMLTAYLKYLRETFLCSYTPPEGLVEYQHRLGQLADSLAQREDARINGLQLHAADVAPTPSSEAVSVAGVGAADGTFEYRGSRVRSTVAVVGFGPEYAAVISVCSVKTWVAPYILAEAVSQLEKAMIEAECQVSYSADPATQSQLAKMAKDVEKMKDVF